MISKILCRLSSFLFAFILLLAFAFQSKSQGNCIKYDIIGGNAPKGDCIWVPVIVYNFDSLIGFQIGIYYDPQVVMPIDKWAAKLPGLDTTSSIFIFGTQSKLIKVVWTDPSGTCTSSLKDGDTLIMVKFKLIGEPGSCTSISFTPEKIFTNEFLDCNVDPYCIEEINTLNNQICIGEPVNLCVIAHSCGTLTNTGMLTITPYGGMPGYKIEWLNPVAPTDYLMKGESKTYNNLFPGNYLIHVSDTTGKDTFLNINIGIANTMVIMPTAIKQPMCLGDSNGVISIKVTGGSGDLTIGWRPINVYGDTTVKGLKVGNYTVTVIDTAGCKTTEDFLLFADTIFHKVDIIKDATCADDGKVIVHAWGGNPCPPNNAYCFFWSQHNSFNVCDSVSHNDSISGKQWVAIQDCRGCLDTAFFEVKFSGDLLDSLVIDPIKCFGDSGTIHSFISSKGVLNGPMAFRLSDINNMTKGGGVNGVADYISPKLKAGKYYLDIVDNGGCSLRDSFILTQPQLLEIIDVQTDTTETCNPGKDAFLHVRGFGGTIPYTFKWSNNIMGPNNDTLVQGIYTITLTDANGCTAIKTYIVTQPNGPVINSFTVTNPICAGDKNGSVTVNFTPGSGVLKPIKWSVSGATTATINNLGVGRYIVTISDVNGCFDIDSIDLKDSGKGLSISNVSITKVKCNGNSDGCIAISTINAQGPPIYDWTPNVGSSSVICNLAAGMYCLHLHDNGTCPAIDTCFVLDDPPPIDIQLTNVTEPSCATAGTCDGSAMVMGLGPDSTYQIIWSSGETSLINKDTALQLCSGDQYVIVTNGNFCADTLLFVVPEPTVISIDTPGVLVKAPSCYLSKDGIITLSAKGGTGPYQFKWANPMVTSKTINNLGDGLYFVDIVDSKNCVHTDSIRLRQPDSIRVDIILGSTLDVSCPGKSDGRITTAWTGGNRGKGTFQWTPNINPADSIATNLKEGKYILTVTDQLGCTGSNEYTILAPPPISYTMTTIDTPKCENDQILFSILQANGGSGPVYKFTINSGAPNNIADLVPLYSGNYSVRIYDKNNCFIDTSIFIANPSNALSLDFGVDTIYLQLGDSVLLDGKLNSTGVIDTIIWNPVNGVSNPSSTTSYVSPTQNTTYTLSVIDENGCEVSDLVNIILRTARMFYVPNIFSPNGDNINDFFTLHVGQGIKSIKSVQIFDRWGNKVYASEYPIIDSDIINTWNGRSVNGDFMNPAVFVYIVEVVFKDGRTIVYRGDLTLTR